MSEIDNPLSEPQAEAGEPSSEQRIPLPPATLEFLMLSLRTQAELQLGLIHFGDEKDRPRPDLDLARHSIDLLGVLHEKTKGNLTLEEQRLLENSLTELRFRYVQALEESKKS
ncbi:MAG TPA: DUF1844 domain-containing protein [Bryobacteraceae bacterium]|nr:DUF1844 domain-containing protein [Bryobacteraceae bacterium]